MARRKRKQNRISFKKGFFKSLQKLNFDWVGPTLLKLLKVAFIVGIIAGVGISLHHIDKKYIRPTQSNKFGGLALDAPPWVHENEELKGKIIETAGGARLRLDEKTAAVVRENLKSISWMEVKSVQTKSDCIYVEADYRVPVAMLRSGDTKFYVDSDMVVLDYIPMPLLYIVEIKNASLQTETPRYGEVWNSPDVAAALKIIEKINQMDDYLKQTDPSIKDRTPLITEIASIDVSNYHGVKSRSNPHIILYSHDNTPIHWGAEIGAWQKAMESPDAQKLAKLFKYYQDKGTLNCANEVNYINLRDPLIKIPLPGDKS